MSLNKEESNIKFLAKNMHNLCHIFQSKKPLYASIMPERTALLQGDVNLHARAHI